MKQPDLHVLSLGLREGKSHLTTQQLREGNLLGLAKEGYFVRDGLMDTWPVDTNLGWTDIYTRSDGTYCYDDYGEVELSKDDIQLWHTDAFAVANTLHERFGCRNDPQEIIPGRFFCLGPTDLNIGRYGMRNVYFLSAIENGNDNTLGLIPKEDKAAIAIVGYRWTAAVDKDEAKRTYLLKDVMEVADNGVWKIRKELMDARYGAPPKNVEHGANPDWLRKVAAITKFYFDLCILYRHDSDGLDRARKQYATQAKVAEALGLTEQDITRCLGKPAVKANLYPTADFWRRTFRDDDPFNEFNQYIVEENPIISSLTPEGTKKMIEGRTNRLLVKALAKERSRK